MAERLETPRIQKLKESENKRRRIGRCWLFFTPQNTPIRISPAPGVIEALPAAFFAASGYALI